LVKLTGTPAITGVGKVKSAATPSPVPVTVTDDPVAGVGHSVAVTR